MYEFRLDETAKSIRVRTSGFWTVDVARRFVGEYRASAEQARRRWGRVRMLVDARDSMVQANEVTRELTGLNESVCESPGDRIALVVSGGLVKLQADRVAENGTHGPVGERRTFVDPEAAAAWLAEA